MTAIHIDADVLPGQAGVFQATDRRGLRVFVVVNGGRLLLRPPRVSVLRPD